MFTLIFFGNDGEFRYDYGTSEVIEWLFRNPRLRGLSWSFDGDGWSSEDSVFHEADKVGVWYITREV